MKSLLSYFVKFEEENKMLPKEYLIDYAIRSLDQQSIIIITHDESMFSANNNCQKIWILKNYNILFFKKKKLKIL